MLEYLITFASLIFFLYLLFRLFNAQIFFHSASTFSNLYASLCFASLKAFRSCRNPFPNFFLSPNFATPFYFFLYMLYFLLENLRHSSLLKPSNRAQKLFVTKLQIFAYKSYILTAFSIPFSPKYSHLPRSTRLYPNYSALALLYPDYPVLPSSTRFYPKYFAPFPPYSTLTQINSNWIFRFLPLYSPLPKIFRPLLALLPFNPNYPFLL
jgi:hypothetical protein